MAEPCPSRASLSDRQMRTLLKLAARPVSAGRAMGLHEQVQTFCDGQRQVSAKVHRTPPAAVREMRFR